MGTGSFRFSVSNIFNLSNIKNNYSLKNDTHAYIYFIAIITTFSTSGYIALILILIPSILRTQNKIFKIILLILFAACVPIIFQLDFISGKIDSYLEDTNAFSYAQCIYFFYSGMKHISNLLYQFLYLFISFFLSICFLRTDNV